MSHMDHSNSSYNNKNDDDYNNIIIITNNNNNLTTNNDIINNNNKKDFDPPFPSDQFAYDYLYPSANLSQVAQVWKDDVIFLPLCVLYSCAFVFGIIGNLLVICSHAANSKRRTSTSSFLVGLALSDILFLVVCTPHDLVTRMERDISGGRLLCKLGWFVEMVTTSGSVLSLVAVSVERYIVIVHPMRSRTWCRGSRITKVMVALWCVAVLISTPILYIQDTRRYVYYDAFDYIVIVPCADVNGSSKMRKTMTWFQLISVFILPVLSMFFCYAVVIRVLWKSNKQLSQLTEDRGSDKSESRNSSRGHHSPSHFHSVTSGSDVTWFGDSRLDRRTVLVMKPCGKSIVRRNAPKNYGDLKESRKQVIKMLIVIILIFFLFIGPKWCWNLLKRYRIEGMTSDGAFITGIVLNFLPFLHTCANPVIYGFLSSSFRIGLRIAFSQLTVKLQTCFGRLYYHLFFCCCRCCCRRERSDDDDGGDRRCCGRCGRRLVLRRGWSEPCSESLTNYATGLREAWCNAADEQTTAVTSLTAKNFKSSCRSPQPDKKSGSDGDVKVNQ